MPNEIKVEPGETEMLVPDRGPRKFEIIVRDSDIRVSSDRADASNGQFVQDQDVKPVELDSGEAFYAFGEGASTARIEVSTQ